MPNFATAITKQLFCMNCRKLLLGMAVATAYVVCAQNPVIKGQFTADPTARVFNGRVYLYPSHDIPSPIEKLKDWFCMADYHVFSSSYHLELKLNNSKYFLVSYPDMKLKEIADMFGFYDEFHYSKAFKKLFNTSPNAFRTKAY